RVAGPPYKGARPRVRARRVWVVESSVAVSCADGLSGLAPRFPPSVIERRGPRGVAAEPISKSMAAIPSSGSLVATHDYYRRRLGSTSSNSSCGSAEYPGEGIPRHPGERRSTPGCPQGLTGGGGQQHRDLTLLLSELTRDTGGPASFSGSPLSRSWPQCWSPQSSESTFLGAKPAQASTGMITCDLAREAVGKQQPGGQPGQTNSRPPS
ncbi:hypothetical protein EI555_003560, partial [Monodon monoceros]